MNRKKYKTKVRSTEDLTKSRQRKLNSNYLSTKKNRYKKKVKTIVSRKNYPNVLVLMKKLIKNLDWHFIRNKLTEYDGDSTKL